MIWNQANAGRQAMTADNHLARFIGRNYLPLPHWDVRVLDIGPGKHAANQRYLESLGFHVTSIDISHALSNIKGDIREQDFAPESWDIIVDVNTLCHVEGFDYTKLPRWLRDRGQMFSVMPAYGTWNGHLENKGFVICPTRTVIDNLFAPFSRVEVDTAEYTYQGNTYASWLIQARK